jgi:anti-sigma factor RsiW
MNELKLQAYLDGELSAGEAREVAEWLTRDRDAQALFAELTATRTALRENEPVVTLPESREFFWSKIERAITAEAAASERVGVPLLAQLRKFLAPFAGVALVVFLGVLSMNKYNTPGTDPVVHHLAEVESLSDSVSSFSFRSQSENMFVVWLSEKAEVVGVRDESDPEGMPIPMPMPIDDTILQ